MKSLHGMENVQTRRAWKLSRIYSGNLQKRAFQLATYANRCLTMDFRIPSLSLPRLTCQSLCSVEGFIVAICKLMGFQKEHRVLPGIQIKARRR